ncbi:MAG: NAD(P)H-dependent oxidoreductase [Pseudomonadota bacterium]
MNIVVLNGSPKGGNSVTMQSVRFLQNRFPDHEFTILNVSERIGKLERDGDEFQEVVNRVWAAQGVLWAFPLYVLLVPAQYKRFIELITEKRVGDVFKDKYAAALTTSIHFFDHTAHWYIRAVSEDLDMKWLGSYSADMYDLAIKQEQERLAKFARQFLDDIEARVPTAKANMAPVHLPPRYSPAKAERQVDQGDKKVVVLTDLEKDWKNLAGMITRFMGSFSRRPELIHLDSLKMKGGCLGRLRCSLDNACQYHDPDRYREVFEKSLKTADILILAGNVKDRYLSSQWKMFFDRAFYNNHVPVFSGRQVGFLISGPLTQLPELRQILESYFQIQGANIVGLVSDECGDGAELDALVSDLAHRAVRLAEMEYVAPPTFPVVGGKKIFRDEVWGRLRFVFQADHEYYRKNGLYDFPHKDFKTRARSTIFMLLTKIPAFRREFQRRIVTEMIKPHRRALGEDKKKE